MNKPRQCGNHLHVSLAHRHLICGVTQALTFEPFTRVIAFALDQIENPAAWAISSHQPRTVRPVISDSWPGAPLRPGLRPASRQTLATFSRLLFCRARFRKAGLP